MKLQIDTKQKTIKVLEDFNLSELVEALKKLLGDEYGEYKLVAAETDHYIPWTNPIIIQPYVPWRNPYEPWITWQTSYASSGDGIYNIDLQEYQSQLTIN